MSSKGHRYYARRDNSHNVIVVKFEDFAHYLYKITNNPNAFPKAYRYTVVQDIRQLSLRIHEYLYVATSFTPRFKKEASVLRKRQQKIHTYLTRLKAVLMFAATVDNIQIKNFEYLSKQLTDIIDIYNNWIRNTARKIKTLPSKKEYYQKLSARSQPQTNTDPFAGIPRSKDGFIHLTRC